MKKYNPPHLRPVRIARTVIKDVAQLGFVLEHDREDVQVGTPIIFKNARYVVAHRKVEADGKLHVTFQKDRSTRKQRHGAGSEYTLLSNAKYDREMAKRKSNAKPA